MDAVLILPGFGYDGAGEDAFRSLSTSMAADGMDLYVPTYISRSGLDGSRARLQRLIREYHLERYQRVHVFAFLAGAWAFNPLAESGALPNLATVVYDRSPYQERAPRIADETLHLLTWLRYGTPVFDLARRTYPALDRPKVKIAIVVETMPTSFIRKHAAVARRYGPFRFGCDAFMQRLDDCIYVGVNHNQLYTQFADIWPEMLTFIRTGRFTSSATRMPPTTDSLAILAHP